MTFSGCAVIRAVMQTCNCTGMLGRESASSFSLACFSDHQVSWSPTASESENLALYSRDRGQEDLAQLLEDVLVLGVKIRPYWVIL